MSLRSISQRILFSGSLLISPYLAADLVVLQYHHVSDRTPPATSTSVALFDAQMDMISRLEMTVVPLEEGTRDALSGSLGEQNQIALSFDDAYESVYTNAAPILSAHGYPFTIFVNTNAVGSPGYMTWEQLEDLAANDQVTLANHSTDHGHLARRPDEPKATWRQRIEVSLDQAQETLATELGTTEPLFAYPYGEFDQALEKEIAHRGWFGYGQQSGAIGPASSSTRLPRFPMADAYGQLNGLKDKLMSRALPVPADQLPDGVIGQNPPALTFDLPPSISADRLNCFASGMGRIDFEVKNGRAKIQAPRAFNSRRFRYNCTHPAGNGRFYWLSQQWLDLSKPED
ncbi:polysaccharide deacetylase family protein [Marinobacter salinisoli]|uniref:Polysaccharide deacetylase family protein n=1 Tax=Marinobacter salinisoli TaxID=2769486 RepID=A0ABX7MN04_9GAMM|nr:polysaccharide deacetylase family protein [Marinobacter salinisoli]QSP93568.1 polysaccharide deacetylase family protein [Marinobacter salinisoli]